MLESDFIEDRPRTELEHVAAEEEFEAGYLARIHDSSEFRTATRAWRAGWQEADREIERGFCPAASEPLAISLTHTDWSLFGTGRDARLCELPFDTRRDSIWKQGWIRADLELGSKHHARV